MEKRYVFAVALLALLILACGPLNQFQQLNQQRQAVGTSVASISENNHLIAEAYQKLHILPSYRLESRAILRDQAGHQTSYLIVSEYDAAGNIYTLTQMPDGWQQERYFVEGNTYLFEPQYQGWVKLETAFPPETHFSTGVSLTNLTELLIQVGTAPSQAGQETLDNRAVTRYRLRHVVTEIADALELELAGAPLDIRGTLWLDDETGALLKSEIFLFKGKTRQPVQEFRLEVSDVGHIDPITAPSPVVDPLAIVAATATAQAWTVLPVELDHQGTLINFEVIPLQITQTPTEPSGQAEVRLILKQLPDHLFLGAKLEPFLTQLRHQMTLSLPRENLVVTSSGFRLDSSDSKEHRADVLYFFNADLTGFSHAELIIAVQGNPLIAPVPVERN